VLCFQLTEEKQVNSEELEQSLRTEFENYLKDVLAEMRQEFVQFQEKIESEFSRHKSQLDEVFQEVSSRATANIELDPVIKESIVEHMRLAKDEGARITATALAEAEAMEKEEAASAAPTVGVSELRDATNDISSKTTQSSILKTLVHHAAQFTPRGAFFIIKNEHLVGWRVFGKEGNSDEQTVREVFFPVASSTILGEAVRSLSAVESNYGNYDDDSIYLNKLEFGHPDKMFAIPLVVRGRSVAVLYADNGNDGNEVNLEALETLARVASLTVEILALARGAKAEAERDESAAFEEREEEFETVGEEQPAEEEAYKPVAEFSQPAEFRAPEESSFTEQEFEMTPAEFAEDFTSKDSETEIEFGQIDEEAPAEEIESFERAAETEDFSAEPSSEFEFETTHAFEPSETQFEETPSSSFEVSEFEPESFAPTTDPFGAFEVENGKSEAEVFAPEPVEAVAEPAVAAPVKTRFSERNVDLPIEVGEEERRLHNDARRFARLLVSEIKLYNEQKVKEGRDASDLYERLREAIDRSREMYDKRVQPPVAARFDYFHYEIVNTLAEGDENKLGESYPGATV
jgi:hypothetical protein